MTLQTGIIIVGPHAAQAVAVPLMLRYSPYLLTVFPAEITVLYPFVPVEDLDAACARLRDLCAGIAPFEVTLSGYDRFPGVVFMNPITPEPIRAVFRTISAAFPDYPPYGGQFGNDIHPHMTVFDGENPPPLADFPAYAPITFTVDRLHVVCGPDTLDLPWLTVDVILLRHSPGG
jgi:2'-5' RNA ligase